MVHVVMDMHHKLDSDTESDHDYQNAKNKSQTCFLNMIVKGEGN